MVRYGRILGVLTESLLAIQTTLIQDCGWLQGIATCSNKVEFWLHASPVRGESFATTSDTKLRCFLEIIEEHCMHYLLGS